MSLMPLRTRVLVTLLDRLGRRPIEDLDLAGIRAARATINPRGYLADRITGYERTDVQVSTATVPARDGHPIPVRSYQPGGGADPDAPVVIYLHGGGWVQGNVVNYDPLCRHLCDRLGVGVLSVDYRLAPEWPAPTAAYDCIDAARALRRDAMAVCGDSAGGNLAAVLAQAFRDDGDTAIRAQALIYPATDATMQSPSITEHAKAAVLTKASMEAFVGHYVPDDGARRDPLVSPLFGRLDGLPPALIQTADLDPLRDDGSRYAAALKDHGVEVRLTNYLSAPHGFASFPGATRVGAAARAELVSFLAERLISRPGGKVV